MLNSFDDSEDQSVLSKSFGQATIPFLVLILGLFAISSTAIFLKLALRELSVEAILFDRLLIAAIVFASGNLGLRLWNSRKAQNSDLTPPEAKESNSTTEGSQATWLIVAMIIISVVIHQTGRYVYMWALQQTTAVNALTLSNLTPIFAFLGAWLFVGKQFDRRFLIGLFIAMGGGFFLTLEDWFDLSNQSFGTMAILGDSAALLTAMLYAAGILLTEKILKHLPNIVFLTWGSVLSLVFVAPLVWIKDDSILPTTTIGWLSILGLGLISEVIARSLITYSFKHFSSAFLTIFFLLEPFPVAFMAWFLLGEVISSYNIIGFILIVVGLYLAKTGKGAAS